jgi:acyl dehydratase
MTTREPSVEPEPLIKTVTAAQIAAFERCAAEVLGRPDDPTIHTDEALAREAGIDGPPIASGMVTVAFLNEYLDTRFGPAWHETGHLSVAFVAPTRAGETMTVDAIETDRRPTGDGEVVSLEVWCANGLGRRATVGTADLRLPRGSS